MFKVTKKNLFKKYIYQVATYPNLTGLISSCNLTSVPLLPMLATAIGQMILLALAMTWNCMSVGLNSVLIVASCAITIEA